MLEYCSLAQTSLTHCPCQSVVIKMYEMKIMMLPVVWMVHFAPKWLLGIHHPKDSSGSQGVWSAGATSFPIWDEMHIRVSCITPL